MKEHRNPANIHPPVAAYSHQIEIQGPARWLVMSGQIGKREDGSVPDDPIEQLDVALGNVTRNLHAAGMDVEDLVKLTLYLVGDFDLERRRAVTRAHLKEPWPCVTMLVIAGLFDPHYRVEIDAWACRASE